MALDELFGLQDRVMLVVGASSGLGAQCALAFARAGAKVALVARRRDKLEAQERKLRALGAATLVVEADVSDDADIAPRSCAKSIP